MKVATGLMLVLPGLMAGASAEDLTELTEQRFRKLHAELQPGDGELWRSIPWQTSLLAAQSMAAEQKKPLFIWAMDGHPLGCT
ncbi:MAG: hypothetical protein NXI04_13385 [Planctomycetaceae bacterium]|nr:hypothetical protein [Planctomycetaceae bacterium]